MSRLSSNYERARAAVMALWNETEFRSGREPSRFYKFVHFWVLVGRSFVRNRCPLRASALSYASLLALIPMLALAMSVTTSILKDEGADQIELFINKVVDNVMPPAVIPAEEPEVAVDEETGEIIEATPGMELSESSAETDESRVVLAQREAARHIKEFIDNTSGATLGIPAMIALVFVAIAMLTRIEETFNDIWGVTQGRSWGMRVVIYWTTITLGPLLLAGALALATGPQFGAVQAWLQRYSFIGGVIFKLVPMMVLWLTFTMLYKAVPNTRVEFSAALVGGIIGGTLWQLNNVFGFLYVSRVVTQNKIYGSLGLVPVFMFGLYLSWLILLFGAQVAYAFQNRALYLQEKLAENVNQRGREFIALRLMTCLGQRFERGLAPPTLVQMSSELGIPSRLIQQVLQTLLAGHLVSEVAGAEPAYIPARPLESINAHHVLMAMRAVQGQELMTRDEPVREEVYGEFSRIQEAEKSVASAVSILALVNRAEARLELTPAPNPDEIKLKPALVPSIHPPAMEPSPATAEVKAPEESSKSTPAPETTPADTTAGSPGSHANESSFVAKTPDVADSPDKKPITEPARDEDREFPL